MGIVSAIAQRRWRALGPVTLTLALIALAAGVFTSLPGASASDNWPAAGPSSTPFGREVWLAHCETCHGYGIAGAPIPTRPTQWRSRVLKDRETLYLHAIEGFFGANDTQMPPRGGNAELTDEEVRSAVDYMVELALYHLESVSTKQEKTQ